MSLQIIKAQSCHQHLVLLPSPPPALRVGVLLQCQNYSKCTLPLCFRRSLPVATTTSAVTTTVITITVVLLQLQSPSQTSDGAQNMRRCYLRCILEPRMLGMFLTPKYVLGMSCSHWHACIPLHVPFWGQETFSKGEREHSKFGGAPLPTSSSCSCCLMSSVSSGQLSTPLGSPVNSSTHTQTFSIKPSSLWLRWHCLSL